MEKNYFITLEKPEMGHSVPKNPTVSVYVDGAK